jgi:hypothetical protein
MHLVTNDQVAREAGAGCMAGPGRNQRPRLGNSPGRESPAVGAPREHRGRFPAWEIQAATWREVWGQAWSKTRAAEWAEAARLA